MIAMNAIYNQVPHKPINTNQLSYVSPTKLIYDLQHALRTNQLILTRQAKICLKTFRTVGYEVLLRWVHPELKIIPADRWIQLAEQHGLINKVTYWLVDNVLKMLKETDKTIATPHAINVSPSTLTENFAVGVIKKIHHYNISPSLLEVEITEATEFTDLSSLNKAVQILRRAGIKVSLDDFGNAYASLKILAELDVDEIKIDKSIVQSTNKAAIPILSSLMSLAAQMNLSVVFEGIETHQHLNLAKELGAHKAQGYLFSKPHPIVREVKRNIPLAS